jgi:transcriptional regulator with XRE-family HTH domain
LLGPLVRSDDNGLARAILAPKEVIVSTIANGKKSAPKDSGPDRSVGRTLPPSSAKSGTDLASLRTRLSLTQSQLARLLSISLRSVASLEAGVAPTASTTRRIVELNRLTDALADAVMEKAIGPWLQSPNPAFDGAKPLEVIERGEIDRLWHMVYLLRSGVAF